jgi:hypothetical protein
MRKLILLSLSLFIIFLSSCKKDDSNPTTPDTPQITNINGNWSGKTSQNENVSFTVVSDMVKSFNIKIRTPSYTQEITISGTLSGVVDKSFLFYSSTSGLSITGNFKSNTSSEGTFNLSTTQGTWSATKQ